MSKNLDVAVIAGSLRKESLHRAIARNLSARAPAPPATVQASPDAVTG